MEQQTISLPALTAEEAVELMRSGKDPGSISIEDFRPVKGLFELVPPVENPNNQITTHQQVGFADAEKRAVLIRTEFQQIIPVRHPEEPANPIASVSLAFACQIVYRFPAADSDEKRRLVWAQIMAVMHTWPYWRTFALSSMSQMQTTVVIPSMILPTRAAEMVGYKPAASASPTTPITA